jgi:hypothetical protein
VETEGAAGEQPDLGVDRLALFGDRSGELDEWA